MHPVHMTTQTASPEATQPVAPANLAGVKEIAEALETRTTNVTTWITRRATNGFPTPLRQLAMGGVYDLEEVLAWRRGTTRS